MSGVRILAIAFHALVSGALVFGAVVAPTPLYAPADITRVFCALGALAFGYEAYTMICEGGGNDKGDRT